MTDPNDEFQEWMRTWHEPDVSPPAGDALRGYVRRRSAVLMTWVVVETTMAIVATALLVYLAVSRPDPIERGVMGALALACAAALLFGWWNWRGLLRAVGETTAVYLELSTARLLRHRRALMAGWVLLGVEMAALTPWVWYRTRADASIAIWPWVLLVTLGVLAAVWLTAIGRWVRREEAIVEGLRREYGNLE